MNERWIDIISLRTCRFAFVCSSVTAWVKKRKLKSSSCIVACTGCGINKYPSKLFACSEQPLGILLPNFSHLLRVYSLVKLPEGVLFLTTTKLLIFCVTTSSFLTFTSSGMCAERWRAMFIQTHYYSNNITNNLAVTFRT